jgi:hypothetical protein
VDASVSAREFVGVVLFLLLVFVGGLTLARWQAPSPSLPLAPLAQGPDKDCLATDPFAFVKAADFCHSHPGTSDCWAEIVHAGILCHRALGCADAKTDEEARSLIIPECDVPCVDIMHALDAHYGVSR